MRVTLDRVVAGAVALGLISIASCDAGSQSDGEKLARANCSACHAFPEPALLDKATWRSGVLPRMAPRLGVAAQSLSEAMGRDTNVAVLNKSLPQPDWEKIVAYYVEHAPDSLPYQSLPAEPHLDPPFFAPRALTAGMSSSGIITLLRIDSVHRRIFIGEAGSNLLRIVDWSGHPISSIALGSPPTDIIIERDSVLVLESGILDPNDQPKGSLVKYELAGGDSLRSPRVVLDSLFRPVFVRKFDFAGTGRADFVVCEYGNNRGRLALYRPEGSKYARQILAATPGAIRFEFRDLTGDGAPDLVVLFAQADERIVVYRSDGKGSFDSNPRVLARFPPVYGSMYFAMHDFNGDGHPDIIYVNGDNFDYSRVLKPYHGVRILENDGRDNFKERFFFPVYGAARAEVADFDGDGDLDIVATSNFADFRRHPERGIVFLRNDGEYRFAPYTFSVASGNEWNLTDAGDLNGDGRPDVIVGAMDLQNVGALQQRFGGKRLEVPKESVLLFENRMNAGKSSSTR
jgi:hypothetical protein